MVRHEAAEALGAIASSKTVQLLKDFAADPEPIVAHSCLVALDVLEFEQAGGFQYADTGATKGGEGEGGEGDDVAHKEDTEAGPRRNICICRS
jgi:deoxyhypusine monooxygenase